jgi:glycosyltransferase involved in cell wall biosynthesis
MKIRVLQIIKGLDIGGDSGGAELFGIKLARELNKIPECEVWICAFYSVGTKTENDWCKKLNREGINTFFVSEWGGYNNPGKFSKGLINLIKGISRLNLDVCHSHFQLGTLASVTLKCLGYTKTAYRTSHIRKEWDIGKWTWLLSPMFIKRIFPKYLDGEVGVSRAVRDYLLIRRPGKIDESKIHLIYNGIDVNQIREASLRLLNESDLVSFEQSTFIIGCVGRLAEQKGYPYIFEALPKIINHIPDCILQVAGDGELKYELHEMVQDLNLSDHVKFLGLRNDIPALMRQWDVFVLPSLWEGLPTVVMESMVCGVPVIATDIPGTNELVIDHETGILVPVKNPEFLADAIIKIYQNPVLRSTLVENARQHVKNFSMENIAKEYHAVFKHGLR